MNEYQKIFYDEIINSLKLDSYFFNERNQKILSCFDIEDYKKIMYQRIFSNYSLDDIFKYDCISELVLKEYILMLDFEFDSYIFIIKDLTCLISNLYNHIIIKIGCYNYESEKDLKEYNKFKSYLESLPLWEKLKEQGFMVGLSYEFYNGEDDE